MMGEEKGKGRGKGARPCHAGEADKEMEIVVTLTIMTPFTCIIFLSLGAREGGRTIYD